jgi:hypothetical protein
MHLIRKREATRRGEQAPALTYYLLHVNLQVMRGNRDMGHMMTRTAMIVKF